MDVLGEHEVGVVGEELGGSVLAQQLEQLPADGQRCVERLRLSLRRHPPLGGDAHAEAPQLAFLVEPLVLVPSLTRGVYPHRVAQGGDVLPPARCHPFEARHLEPARLVGAEA